MLRLPILVLMLGGLSAAMLVPMLLGILQEDWRIARSFLYSAIFALTVAVGLAFVMAGRGRASARRELIDFALCWLVVPAIAALPVTMITPAIGINGAWFEMVASLTTTGGTVYNNLSNVPDAIHLWRGMVGWIGGLMTLVAAYAILAPRRLGGFEVDASPTRTSSISGDPMVALGAATPPLDNRIARALRVVLPIYAGSTLLLAVAFHGLGQGGLGSVVHAMSILSTSGISPYPGGLAAADSPIAEVLAAALMVVAAIRVFYGDASQVGSRRYWRTDPELRLLVGLVLVASMLLFGRHWVGALTIEAEDVSRDMLAALWGNVFTVLSFLTTTGFESASWEAARNWSGLANPGLILLGLAAVGGGAATTAGGIKLIRAYALVRHGFRELERIAKPDSVFGVGEGMRGMMRRGAVIAWTFIMLYFMVLLLVVLGLTATGLRFEDALIAATAALSNTGPVFEMVSANGSTFADLDVTARCVLAIAMIAARIEMLALIAIFNTDIWAARRKTSDGPNATIKHW